MADSAEGNLKIVAGIVLTVASSGTSYAWLGALAGSALISSALEVDPPSGPEEGLEGALRNRNSNKAYIPVIYGTRRVGGTRVFVSTRGADNAFMDIVLVVAEGPIKGFKEVYLDDAWLQFGSTVPQVLWEQGSSFKIGQDQEEIRYNKSYEVNDVVFYNDTYWICVIANNGLGDPPSDTNPQWDETTPSGTGQEVLNSAGGFEPWYPMEGGRVYLNVTDVTGFTPGLYVAGQTSGATARIESVDAVNDFIYIYKERPNSTTNKGFSLAETIEERPTRSGTPTGTSSAGISVMRNVEPQYFKEDTLYTVGSEVMPNTSDKVLKETKQFTDLVTFRFYNGSTTQAAGSGLVAGYSEWTSNHQLKGKAYIHITLRYDKDRMTGIPTITALLDGREVYDPRDLTTKFESNPALCVRDYLTNDFYGRDIAEEAIDDTSFIAAANYCDEQITITDQEYDTTPTGTNFYVGDRYNCNAVVDTKIPIFENIQKLLLSMRGWLTYTNGLYKLIADKETSSYHTFDEHNIVGGISASLGTKRNTFNEVKLIFPNSLNNWDSDEVTYFSDTIKNTLDNGLPLIKDITINTISNQHQALYIALQELKQSRQQISISFTTGMEGLLVETGDVIRVRNLHYGWGTKTATIDGEVVNVYNTRTGADIDYHEIRTGGVLLGDDANPMYKEFRVLNVTLNGDLEVEIVALEYDPTVYTTFPPSVEDSTPNTNLTDSRIALPPRNISAVEYLYVSKDASGFKAGILLDWDSSESPWDQSYEISAVEPAQAHVDGNAYIAGSVVYSGIDIYQCVEAIAVGTSNVPGAGASQTTTTINKYYTVLTDGGVADWSLLFAGVTVVEVGQTYQCILTSADIDVTLSATGATVRETSWDLITDIEFSSNSKVLGITEDRSYNIKDAKEGYYLIEIRTINVTGRRSDPSRISFEVQGLSAPPGTPTGVGLIVSNETAILTWDKAVDLDVLISGSVQIRHNVLTDLSGLTTDAALEALWQNSKILTEGKSGATSQVFLPLIVGTYLIKFIDASGIPSVAPAYVINQIAPKSSVTLVTSFSELTDFTTASFDGLTADAETRAGFDTVGLEKITHDSVDKLQFDTTAGTFGADPLVQTATYYLHNPIYFDKLVDAEFNVDVLLTTYDTGNLVSTWTSIDALTSIDDPPISANLVTKIATTTDDPTDPNAAWSEYFTFLTGSVKCHGARAAVEVSVNTADTQILIEDIIFSFSGKERVETVNNLQWTTADFTAGFKDVWYVNPFFDGAGIVGAQPVVPILNITLNSSVTGITSIVSNGTQEYENGPGANGPTPEAGFRLQVSTFSALNTTTTLLNSNVDFGYQAIGY